MAVIVKKIQNLNLVLKRVTEMTDGSFGAIILWNFEKNNIPAKVHPFPVYCVLLTLLELELILDNKYGE